MGGGECGDVVHEATGRGEFGSMRVAVGLGHREIWSAHRGGRNKGYEENMMCSPEKPL